jgi:hypothetical protein
MKNSIVRFQFFIFCNFIILPFSQGQIREFSRGHISDDLYVWCYPLTTTTYPTFLLYITDYGLNSIVVNNDYQTYWNLTADPIPGKIIGQSDRNTHLSTDYGVSFNYSYPFVKDNMSIMDIYGGNIPGEFLYMIYNVAIWPLPLVLLYKTSDYGITFNQVVTYVPPILNGEVGSISGEIYQIPILDGHANLCHSIDFGVSFDSIPIDSTIINENAGLNFFKLSHCSQQGELFLITKSNNSTYHIYHTTNYGNTWVQKNTLTFDSEYQLATAGRADCSFYFANLKETVGSDYFTLEILYSADCGQTFTTYDHPLAPEVGINDLKSNYSGHLSVNPNPVKDITTVSWESNQPINGYLSLYNSVGTAVSKDRIISSQAGIVFHQMDLSKFSAGIYLLKLELDNSSSAIGKLIISR